jgi:5-methylcytosine-specific restriction endonuclease McrA
MAMREVPRGEWMKWTKEADDLISNRELTAEELAHKLGVSSHAIYQRRSKLGVKFWKDTKPTKGNTCKWPRSLKYIKKWVLKRDNYVCAYCGGIADQVDHVIPKRHGGSNFPNNLVASCSRCNGLKGTSCADCLEWRKLIG